MKTKKLKPEQIQPLGDRVLIRKEDPDGVSAGGVYYPDQSKDRPRRGKVLAVGPGKPNDAGVLIPVHHGVCVGAVVLFSTYGTYPDPDDKLLALFPEGELLAVVEDEK
jgi:chaperonin GroES